MYSLPYIRTLAHRGGHRRSPNSERKTDAAACATATTAAAAVAAAAAPALRGTVGPYAGAWARMASSTPPAAGPDHKNHHEYHQKHPPKYVVLVRPTSTPTKTT